MEGLALGRILKFLPYQKATQCCRQADLARAGYVQPFEGRMGGKTFGCADFEVGKGQQQRAEG